MAESHDLCIGLAVRIEIASSLSSAHRKSGQRILEDLFESEEFQDGKIDALVESESALVRSDSVVELHPVSSIHLDIPVLIDSRDSEHDGPFRFDYPFEDLLLLIDFVVVDEVFDGFYDFFYRLYELRLVRILFLYLLKERFAVKHCCMIT